MKRLFNQLLTVAILGSFTTFMIGCGDDEDPVVDPPEISITLTSTDSDTEYEVGEEVNLTVGFVTEAELSGINWTVTVDGVAGTKVFNAPSDLGLTNTETAGSVDLALDVLEDYAGLEVSVTIEVVDKENNSDEDTYTFTVLNDPSVEIYEAFLLAAPLGSGDSETFFSTSNGELYSLNDVNGTTAPVSAEIDFGYYYGATNQATLAGIESYPTSIVNVDAWGTQNNTLFRTTTITTAEFDALTEFDGDAIAEAFELGSAEAGQKTQLAAGNVLAFRTDATKDGGSKFGLVKIVSITGTDGAGDGINIEVKVNL